MISRILAPTDGSDFAEKATKIASDLAEKYGASLHLLYVVKDDAMTNEIKHMAEVEHLLTARSGTRGAPVPRSSVDGLFEALRQDANLPAPPEVVEYLGRCVTEKAKRAAEKAGVKDVRSTVRSGNPAKEILAYADHEAIDLIVMGSRGLSKLKELFMGSVSEGVAQKSSHTCVTVH